jgi:hypothetical protein
MTETQQSEFLEILVKHYPTLSLGSFGISGGILNLSEYPAIDLKTTYQFDSKPEGGMFRTISTRTKPAIHPELLGIIQTSLDQNFLDWYNAKHSGIVRLLEDYDILGGMPNIGHLGTPDCPNLFMCENPVLKEHVEILRKGIEYLNVISNFRWLYKKAAAEGVKLEDGIEALTERYEREHPTRIIV